MERATRLAESQKNYQALVSEFQQSKQVELSTTETKVASLAQDVTKAGQRADFQRLAAPIEKVGLVYPTRVSMDRATIQVEGKQVPLSPGMAVTVEIKTGQRRVIEYLLSPLLKSVQESLRER
jgi:hypothetical protein